MKIRNLFKSQPAPKRGFTLVELLITLGIIASLVGGALYAMGGTNARGRAVADKKTLATIQAAVDRMANEYGSCPSYWDATTGAGKVLTTAEVDVIMASVTGVVTTGNSSAAFAAYAAANPTMQINDSATAYSGRCTMMSTSSGAGSGNKRIVVLQYRSGTSGLFVNGDGSISTALIPASTAVTADFATSAAWTTAGKAVWPF